MSAHDDSSGRLRNRCLATLSALLLGALGVLGCWALGLPSGAGELAPAETSRVRAGDADREAHGTRDAAARTPLAAAASASDMAAGPGGEAPTAASRWLAGLCIDGDGQRLRKGTLSIRSPSGRESRVAVLDGAFRIALDASFASTDFVEAMVSDELAMCVVFSGALRIGEDLRIFVERATEVIRSGSMAWSGRHPEAWRALLFGVGTGSALSVPTSMHPHRGREAVVSLSWIDLGARSDAEPVAWIATDERFQPRARLVFASAAAFEAALRAGIRVEGTFLTISAADLQWNGSSAARVQCTPIGIEVGRAVPLDLDAGSARGLVVKARHFVVAAYEGLASRRIGRIDLREAAPEATVAVDWFGELPGPCVLAGRVVDREGRAQAGVDLELRALGEPWEGLLVQWLGTDEHGRFSVAELPAGSFRVRASRPSQRSQAEAILELPAGEQTLVLGDAETVELALRWDGEDRIDAFRRLSLWEADAVDPSWREVGGRVSSASLQLRGTRRRAGLRIAGQVREAEAVFVGVSAIAASSRSGDGRHVLRLGLAQPVTGSLVDSAGVPAAGYRVVALRPGEPGDGDAAAPWQRGQCGADGSFQVHVREGDAFALEFFAPGDSLPRPFVVEGLGARRVHRLTR